MQVSLSSFRPPSFSRPKTINDNSMRFQPYPAGVSSLRQPPASPRLAEGKLQGNSCRSFFAKESPMSPHSPNVAGPTSLWAALSELPLKKVTEKSEAQEDCKVNGKTVDNSTPNDEKKPTEQAQPMEVDAPEQSPVKEINETPEALGAALDVLANIAGMIAVKEIPVTTESPAKAFHRNTRPPRLDLVKSSSSAKLPIAGFINGNKPSAINNRNVLIAPRRVPHLTAEHKVASNGHHRIEQRQSRDRSYSLAPGNNLPTSQSQPRSVPQQGFSARLNRSAAPTGRGSGPPPQNGSRPAMDKRAELTLSNAHVSKMRRGQCPMYNCTAKIAQSDAADVLKCEGCSRKYWRPDDQAPLKSTCCPILGCTGRVVVAHDARNGELHGCSVCRLVFQQVKRGSPPVGSVGNAIVV